MLLHPVSAFAAVDPGPEAVRHFGGCLAGNGQGHLLLLVDTSASLKHSDAHDQRVEAANYLVSELANFVDQSGAQLEVAVAGFADDFAVTLGWTSLAGGGPARVLRAVDGYRDQDSGFETDYWNALNGARRYLTGRAQASDCTALVWLSDGSHDLDKRDSADERSKYGTTKPYGPHADLVDSAAERQLEHAGVADLCRTGGVADALRVDGITTLAIGLQGGLAAADFNLMEGIATGSRVDDHACGAREGRKLGAFVLAKDVPGLFFAFDEFVDPDHPPARYDSRFCQGEVCSEYDHQFVLDPSISSVRILGGSQLKKYYAALISPTGKQVRLHPGEPIHAAFDGFAIRGRWRTDSVFSLTLDRRADRGWTGVWRMVFVDPDSTGRGSARSNIRLYGDVYPAWPDSSAELVVGEQPRVRFGLQRRDKTPIDPASIAGALSWSADLEYADGTSLPIATGKTAGDLVSPLRLDLRKARSGPAVVHLALRLTTADVGDTPGTTLEPQVADYPVTVRTPPSYPKVPATLDFGSGDTASPVMGSLKVQGDGCVWLADAQILTLPDGVADATVTADASSRAACVSGALPVTLTPSHIGTGLLSGTLRVLTKSASATADPVAVTVNYRYEMERPANKALRGALFGVLLFLGLLIPLLMLLAVKWWTAKIGGSALSWLTMSGPVGEGTSFLAQAVPDVAELRTMSLDGAGRKSVVVSPRVTLRARARLLDLSGSGRVVVETPLAVTSAGDTLPLAVQDHWVAALDPTNPGAGPVEVILLLAPGAAALSELMADARAKVPEAVRHLRSRMGARELHAASLDEWGAPVDLDQSASGGSSDHW